MSSYFVRRSLRIDDRDVRICIEHPFWASLEDIARAKATTTSNLVASIVASWADVNMTSAIRAYVLHHFQKQAHDLDDITDASRPSAQKPVDGEKSDTDQPRWLN